VDDIPTFDFPSSVRHSLQAKKEGEDLRPPCWVVGLLTVRTLEQKCNAKRPCSTCIKAKSISECVYDDDEYGYLLGQHIGGAGPAVLNQIPSTFGATRVTTNEPAGFIKFEANQIPPRHSPGLALVRGNSFKQRISLDSSPFVSIVSSFPPPTIPPEPWISLSFQGEDRFQVQFSKIDATDLDMKLYVLNRNTRLRTNLHILAGYGFYLGYSN